MSQCEPLRTVLSLLACAPTRASHGGWIILVSGASVDCISICENVDAVNCFLWHWHRCFIIHTCVLTRFIFRRRVGHPIHQHTLHSLSQSAATFDRVLAFFRVRKRCRLVDVFCRSRASRNFLATHHIWNRGPVPDRFDIEAAGVAHAELPFIPFPPA
jgi:hypothetical protein